MEASTISPEWHQWLHHVVDELPATTDLSAFKPHFLRPKVRNWTGTDKAYSSPHYVGNKDFHGLNKKYSEWKAVPGDSSVNDKTSL